MPTWKTRGKRGDALEDMILLSNDYYLKNDIARIDKAATPVKVVEIDGKGSITKAFFEKKATVDFYGIAQGVFMTFDAKETHLKNFPLKNIHPHQIDYMKNINTHGGLTFLIVHFKCYDDFYLLPFEILFDYYQASKKGHRKSIPYSEMIDHLKIRFISGGILHYLEAVNHYIDWRKTNKLYY